MPRKSERTSLDREAGGHPRSAVAAVCPPTLPRLRPLSQDPTEVNESEEGSKERAILPRAATPSTGWHTPRTRHRLKLPHPRLSPAFFAPVRNCAIGHPAAVPRRSSRASVASRVLEAVVARPVSVGVAEVERGARKDEPAAPRTPHLPASDEGSEPLSQRPVGATVAAVRCTATAAGALDLLPLTPRARP